MKSGHVNSARPPISTGVRDQVGVNFSRKSSPLPNLGSIPGPEKAHLEFNRRHRIKRPNTLTFGGNPGSWADEGFPKNLTFGTFQARKPRRTGLYRRSFPETLTSKQAGIPRNLTYAPTLLKRRAESLPRTHPEKPHLWPPNCGQIESGSTRLHHRRAPEKPHLRKFLLWETVLNPLTIFPASAHADPRTPSRRLPKIFTSYPVKLHLIGRNPLLGKASPWR